MQKLRVAVLMGGTSAERAISLSTGRQIVAALDPVKYIAMALDAAAISGRQPELPPGVAFNALPSASAQSASTELAPLSLSQMAGGREDRPDVVLIALHGKGGEDGTVQGLLELLGIPYTGSGVLASALAMDKAMAKKLLRAEGIPVPSEILVNRESRPPAELLRTQAERELRFPVIVKPNAQGSTIGCTIVDTATGLEAALDTAFKYDSSVLVEEFIRGIEITAGVLGNAEPQVLPLIEIEAKGGFYDYEAKYAPGGSTHTIPARISETAADRARAFAARSHLALGCRGMCRVDMIVADDDVPYVLELNTIPGMTPTSLLPEAAKAAGIEFPELLDRIIAYALEGRQPAISPSRPE